MDFTCDMNGEKEKGMQGLVGKLQGRRPLTRQA
jgi:hypothetical protein